MTYICQQQVATWQAQMEVGDETMIDKLLGHRRRRVRRGCTGLAPAWRDGDRLWPQRHGDLAADFAARPDAEGRAVGHRDCQQTVRPSCHGAAEEVRCAEKTRGEARVGPLIDLLGPADL